MKTPLLYAMPFAAGTLLMFSLNGCYTQLGSMEDAYDDSGIAEEVVEEEPVEEFDRDYPTPNDYIAFTYYQPRVSITYGWGYPGYYPYDPFWYSPYYSYYGWCYTPPVYTCWPYAPVYYPTPYYGHYYPGKSYPGGSTPIASDTRDFGSRRGFTDGTRRTRGGSEVAPRTDPSGTTQNRPVTVSKQLPPRRGLETVAAGSAGNSETPKRRAVQRRPPPSRGTVSTPPPPAGNDSGTVRGGSQRGSVSSRPPSSTPPASSTPGGQSSSRSGGSQRTGGRR